MGRKILVVDDEPVLVETMAYNLEQAGYQVTTAIGQYRHHTHHDAYGQG